MVGREQKNNRCFLGFCSGSGAEEEEGLENNNRADGCSNNRNIWSCSARCWSGTQRTGDTNKRGYLNWTPAAGSDGSGRLQRSGFGGIKAGAAQREVVTRPNEAEGYTCSISREDPGTPADANQLLKVSSRLARAKHSDSYITDPLHARTN